MPFDASPTHVRRVALVVALTALVFCGVNAYRAVSNELTGEAIYRIGMRHTVRHEHVTRESSPAKFRQATNFIWVSSGFSMMVSIGAFVFYRKIDDTAAAPF